MTLPNFLGIGTQRGATTWLYNCLKEHPEIFVPEIKELSFFNKNYSKGLEYYSSFFSPKPYHKALGEITPSYIYCEECPRRISEKIPHIKLIVILRNPVDRAFSEYQFFLKRKTGWNFEESIERYKYFVDKGLYYIQLERYFSFFKRKQFLIMLFDELRENNMAFIESVYTFLGVNSDFRPSWIEKASNASSFQKLRDVMESLHLSWAIEPAKKVGLDYLVRKLYNKKLKHPAPDEIKIETRKRLIEYFREPNERLGQLIDRDLSAWNKFSMLL